MEWMKLTNALANHQYDWIIWQKKKKKTVRKETAISKTESLTSHIKKYIYTYIIIEKITWKKTTDRNICLLKKKMRDIYKSSMMMRLLDVFFFFLYTEREYFKYFGKYISFCVFV